MKAVIDSETVTVSSSPVSLTQAKIDVKMIMRVSIYCEGTIRFWTSGKDPTGDNGLPMFDGSEREISAWEALSFRAVRITGGTDAKIHVQYIRDL